MLSAQPSLHPALSSAQLPLWQRRAWRSLSAAVCGCALLLCGAPSADAQASGGASAAKATSTPATAQPQVQATPMTPAEQYAAQQHATRIQDLVTRAHASYVSGVNNYNANRLDAARADFDAAVDLMLSSGMDLKNDPQLSEEFERLLDSINSLEILALKQGNGFSPKLEEAPAEEADAEATFAPDPALVGRITAQVATTKSDFPLVVNDYVAGFISFFSNSRAGQATLRRSLERAGKYQAMISKDLSDAGLPQDLIYLGVAESGFQPQRVNRISGAGGMWQFMPFQGAYGLQRNGYFDERFDPEKSSLAYARYMKYLYTQFGDWYLAMAAYNWGPGNVQRAVQRTGYADFWELYRRNVLPRETKNYVPLIVAAIIMAKNPQQYGLANLVPDAPILSDTVNTDYAIDLRLVSDLTGASLQEIVTLNPALLRLSTPRDIAYDLHLPAGTRDVYMTRIKDVPEEYRATWRFHVAKAGDTLESIATAYHVSPTAVSTYNEVTPSQPIEAGDELVIPVASASSAASQQRYTVHRGDTLVSVADRFNVTVEQLHDWNPHAGGRLTVGRSINVAEPVHLAPGFRSRRGRAVSTRSGGRARGKARSTSTRTSRGHASASSARSSKSGKAHTRSRRR